MAKFVWQDGTLVSKAKVEVGGTIYEVDPEEYSGSTPLSASNLNAMVDNIYADHAIASGSNENGNYVKFADGTMICYREISTTIPCNSSWGSLYYGVNSTTYNFAQEFISKPTVTTDVQATTATGLLNGYYNALTITTTGVSNFSIIRPSSNNNVAVNISILAIGKWK